MKKKKENQANDDSKPVRSINNTVIVMEGDGSNANNDEENAKLIGEQVDSKSEGEC